MEEKMIYDLIDRFESSELSVMTIEKDDIKLHLEKGNQQVIVPAAPITQSVAAPMGMQVAGQAVGDVGQMASGMNQISSMNQASVAGETQETVSSYEKVKSPIVGVFYEAPSPNDAPYVTLGQKVEKGQVLCLVEAMKMMNELKSPVDGVIKSIYGQNGELVEFDQVLFEVEEC